MLSIYKRTIKDKKIFQESDIKLGCWVNIVQPSIKELKSISKIANLDIDTITNVLDPFEQSRIEIQDNTIYIFIKAPFFSFEEKKTAFWPILIIITSQFFITIANKKFPFFSDFIFGKINFYTTQKTKFLIQLFLRISKETIIILKK